MPRVLVIDDQPNLLRSITAALRECEIDAVGAPTLQAADQLMMESFDAVVLDLMLPDGNGLDWLNRLRASGNQIPVMVLTARDSVSDRVKGLDNGADDYLVKPFALEELLARARALLRRESRDNATSLSAGDVHVDLLNRTVRRNNEEIDLQPRQFELLVYLMRHANETVTREMIAAAVWREPTTTWTNVIEVHINQLRKRLELPGREAILHTVRGKGYQLGDLP